MKKGPIIVNPQVFENLGPIKDERGEEIQIKEERYENPDLKVYTYDEIWEAIYD